MSLYPLRQPPRMISHRGLQRRVGVEIEFAAIAAHDGANLVRELFGGAIVEEDPHRYHIRGTSLGDFTSELDTQYAHRPYDSTDAQVPTEGSFDEIIETFRAEMRVIFGNVSALVMPCEIVGPPLEIERLGELERLVEGLREAGALGTRASPLYGFGAQLNPEIAKGGTNWITAVLKAYLLLSDWLRAVIDVDITRRLIAFADPFPTEYALLVTEANYWPSLERLIDDYLEFNPTRNRELDLLPLFCWLDESRIRSAIADPRVKPRPTFHYRLPDANLGQPGWGIGLEWNRWCMVEQLAEDRDKLARMGQAYRDNSDQLLPANWALKGSEWLWVK